MAAMALPSLTDSRASSASSFGRAALDPRIDVKGLVLESVGELVRHDGLLLIQRNPVRDVELLGFGIVETGDLVGENVQHEGIERKILGDQAEGFESLRVGVALGFVFVFFFLADQVVANFLLGAKGFLERFLDGQIEKLAHLREHFIGGVKKFGLEPGETCAPKERRARGCGRGALGRRACTLRKAQRS